MRNARASRADRCSRYGLLVAEAFHGHADVAMPPKIGVLSRAKGPRWSARARPDILVNADVVARRWRDERRTGISAARKSRIFGREQVRSCCRGQSARPTLGSPQDHDPRPDVVRTDRRRRQWLLRDDHTAVACFRPLDQCELPAFPQQFYRLKFPCVILERDALPRCLVGAASRGWIRSRASPSKSTLADLRRSRRYLLHSDSAHAGSDHFPRTIAMVILVVGPVLLTIRVVDTRSRAHGSSTGPSE